MEQKGSRRENWIDAAKGIAILIVVLNHSGLVIPGVNFWGGMFYVPAFFLLAGYTYAPKEETLWNFVKRKAKRLLVPYFAANGLLFLFFLVWDFIRGTFQPVVSLISFLGILYGRNQLIKGGRNFVVFNAPIPDVKLMINLNAPTWFLPALFLVLVGADALFRLMKGSKRRVNFFVAFSALIMLIYHYLSPFLLPWCIDILPYLLVFFLAGYAIKEEHLFEKLDGIPFAKRCGIVCGILALTVAAGVFNGSYNLSLSYFGKTVSICMIAAVGSTCLLLLLLRLIEKKIPKVTALMGRLGRHTLSVLCWHYFVMQMFFAAAGIVIPDIWEGSSRVMNQQVLWFMQYVVLLCGMVVSVAVPIAGSLIYRKFTKD
ncbi:MAG: acyltransferase [Lachnospiraceae bacterium]|nr:acyltransferase [Lachnospiraceae bacterium]